MDCFAALAMTAEGPAINTSFTILIDRMFTISIRRAFTKLRDAAGENCWIA
ncbi:hypothetical protein [Bradyrhizobium sp. CCBAU 51753]|uniref:hypothetical protein n=1 Tax=Bradyrhizobium sp. CCBAU 51753 TaxID=1325100 RepID=UPI00188DBE7F|nr:hypothetical protein [Bradyrhizobium sp. CCBAU 51753]